MGLCGVGAGTVLRVGSWVLAWREVSRCLVEQTRIHGRTLTSHLTHPRAEGRSSQAAIGFVHLLNIGRAPSLLTS